MSTLKALTLLATREGGHINLQQLNTLSPKLVELLHKAQRSIHLNTLETMDALLSRYPSQFNDSVATFQGEIVKFIDETDIQRSSLALRCANQIIKSENWYSLNEN